MAITLTNSNALCTMEEAKALLSLTTNAKDELIKRLILSVSDHIESVCGRKFRKEAVSSEKFRGYGSPRLYVKRPPIDTGASISIAYDGGTALDATEYAVEDADTGLIYLKGGFTQTAPLGAGASYRPISGFERASWAISYTGGYVLPNDSSGTRSLPYQIETVALNAVVAAYRMIGRDRSIKNEALMSWSASYSDTPGAAFDGMLTEDQRAALAPWTRFVQA